ncbi:unnamed protein product [Didymodactylos carnosus]|uniref:Tetratricopeptide repeat protein n=1 Tax=Didymodactylos carnosus TaxID=1234261 RepID=A0A814U6E5_9BILA|nr:unnamed protein product [Didymodactylos carnosus]CAF1172259.1 unnamed protein product [Didymodactylos carnosus]CAF3636411.1 unnamed protein product [Didymodactylos carnosus]CAF3936191.1 unnamed protein product [Didymodactylos carnosus]
MFSIAELEQLQDAHDQYISFNSFLSTSKDRSVAEVFAGENITSTLIDIGINPDIAELTKPYASISHLSQIGNGDEKEVLFMLGAIFRVESMARQGGIWVLKLQLVNEDQHHLKELYRYRREELSDQTSLADLEPLLSEMNGFGMDKTSNVAKQEQVKYNLSTYLLRGGIQIIKTFFGSDTVWLAQPLTNLALAYCEVDAYQLAIEYLEKCLSIQYNNRCVGDTARICDTLQNLGLVYKKMENYDKALEKISESTLIREQNLTSQNQHLALAESYMITADLYLALKKYDLALEFG